MARGCGGGAQVLRVWFDAGSGWSDLGLICLGPGGPVTIRQLSAEARVAFAKDLPPLRIHMAPPRGVVAQLPVIFDTGQSGRGFTATYPVLGQTVSVSARPQWSWSFGDGAELTTDDPGGPYPHMGVAHAYRRAATPTVGVQADWSATFTVDGLGPFPVPEPVSQSASTQVSVGEGRAVLAVR